MSIPPTVGTVYKNPADMSIPTKPMEQFFRCPYCGEQISMVLDMSVRSQTYIEDCEVCCRPIHVRYVVHGDQIAEFESKQMI